MSSYYIKKSEYHSVFCACELQIDWNVIAISGQENADGYIVQQYSRLLSPKNILNCSTYDDVKYFEAWEVKNGKIASADKGDICDDMFLIGNTLCIDDDLKRSLDTKGCFEFCGSVYWIPIDSCLYKKVENWSNKTVKQANGLKASFSFPEIENTKPLFEREVFRHEWDLIGKENIYQKAKEHLFRVCNKDDDYEMLNSKLVYIFEEKYQYFTKLMLEEWQKEHPKKV